MNLSLVTILGWLSAYGYSVLFPIAVVEGPIITVLAGFLAAEGVFNPFLVLAVVVAADMVGDGLYYALGRFGGEPFLKKYGKLFGIHFIAGERFKAYFHRHAGRLIVLAKLLHTLGYLVLPLAGMMRYRLPRYFFLNLISTVPKSLAFLLVGYFFGAAYQTIAHYLDYGTIVIGAVFLIAIFAGYRWLGNRLMKDIPKE